LPSNCTSVAGNAFSNCPNLETVVLSPSLITIFGNAFYGCTSLLKVTLPASLTTISGNAFQNCTKLVDINLENTALGTTCGTSIFEGCTALKEVILPNSFTTIPSRAFYGCTSLQTVTLPAATTIAIGNSSTTFANCSSLQKVICKASAVPSTVNTAVPPVASKMFEGSSITYKLYVPTALVSAYQTSTDLAWSQINDANIFSIDNLTAVLNVTSILKSAVIYPNPMKSNFSIKNQDEIEDVEIVSLAGQILKSFNQNQSSYSVSGLNKGCYLVRLNSKSDTQTFKIVVE
jgi:hypothetical protein